MSNQPPSTPVKVPSSAANYTPATLDPDLRSQINAILLRDGHVTKIQEHLLHALNANQTNWPTSVQNHALTLLRSGEVTTFPALFRRVLDDVRQDSTLGSKTTTGATANGTAAAADGTPEPKVNGASNGKKSNGGEASHGGGTSLALPQAVIDEALKVTRDALEMVCEVEENGAT